MITLCNIKVNKDLILDYNWTEGTNTEFFADWYLARVLNNGNYSDIKSIPAHLIRSKVDKHLLSRKVKNFWEWYFK